MTGKLPPVTENPVPAIESALIVTGAVPLEVSVTDFVTAVPTETLPKASVVALAVKAGVAAFSCREAVREVPPVVAVSVAVCALVTEETVAVNDAEDPPDATVTLAGTVTALLLLASVTAVPPDGAAELKVAVHVADPAPVNVLVAQERVFREDTGEDVEALRLIEVDFEVVSCIAVNVAVCEVGTADTFAVKPTLVAPDGTVTEEGTETAVLLLASATPVPLDGAAELKVTVQFVDPAPVNELVAQEIPVKDAVGVVAVLLRLIDVDCEFVPWVAVNVAVC